MTPHTTAGADPPGPARERYLVLDGLRGVALFGILLVNAVAFALPGGPPGLGYAGPVPDRLALAAVILFVESKFFCLFSFLFGVGFAVQLREADRRGAPFLPRYGRRLAVLAAFGLAHIALLWEGDILLAYALVGTVLLAFRRVSDRGLVTWAAALLGVPLVLYSGVFLLTVGARFVPGLGDQIRAADTELLAVLGASAERGAGAERSYWETVPDRVAAYAGTGLLLLTRVPTVLAMFLLGLWAGRVGLCARPGAHVARLRWGLRWGLGAGLVLSTLVTAVYFLAPPVTALAGLFFNQALAGPVLGLGYAAGLALALRADPAWARPLAATGRMALTNYLLQSVILAVLFWPQGFGLAGRVRPLAVLALVGAVYLGQVALSAVWLRRFELGPLEWVWRWLTYLRRPALVRRSPAPGPGT